MNINSRSFLIGGIFLSKGKIKDVGLVMKEVCDEIEGPLAEIGFFNGAPFKSISLLIRFGAQDSATLSYGRVNKKYLELPVTIDVDFLRVRNLSRMELKLEVESIVRRVLLDLSKSYVLPSISIN